MYEQFRHTKKHRKFIGLKANTGEIYSVERSQLVHQVCTICQDATKFNTKLSLRQLFYKMVCLYDYPNNNSSYRKLSKIKDQLLISGQLNWDVFTDRHRKTNLFLSPNGIKDSLQQLSKNYQLNRQLYQDNYIELWIEKDSIYELCLPIAQDFSVPIQVTRGYPSTTVLYKGYQRLSSALENGKKKSYLLFLGDHDPSGLNIYQTIQKKLSYFFTNSVYSNLLEDLHFKRIGIDLLQVKQYDIPPNRINIRDSRSKRYNALYGDLCWEIDALSYTQLQELIRNQLQLLVDNQVYQGVLSLEQKHKNELKTIIESTKHCKTKNKKLY